MTEKAKRITNWAWAIKLGVGVGSSYGLS